MDGISVIVHPFTSVCSCKRCIKLSPGILRYFGDFHCSRSEFLEHINSGLNRFKSDKSTDCIFDTVFDLRPGRIAFVSHIIQITPRFVSFVSKVIRIIPGGGQCISQLVLNGRYRMPEGCSDIRCTLLDCFEEIRRLFPGIPESSLKSSLYAFCCGLTGFKSSSHRLGNCTAKAFSLRTDLFETDLYIVSSIYSRPERGSKIRSGIFCLLCIAFDIFKIVFDLFQISNRFVKPEIQPECQFPAVWHLLTTLYLSKFKGLEFDPFKNKRQQDYSCRLGFHSSCQRINAATASRYSARSIPFSSV